ncbi:MAG: chitobiase/beta-hexosaminidase C-terminal domain-containing protein, partial [Lachnospiraceae bacterium]|nr:chitobiase/beta-hexosaminidase C-terminal domain-containing protein [Lachnospiraceae bacterium]
MRKKIVALLLAGSLAVSGLQGVTVYAGTAEEETESMVNSPDEEAVEDVPIEDGEEVVESLLSDNGDVLTAIVPFTEEEERIYGNGRIYEGESTGISDRLLQNLSEYIPEGGELSEEELLALGSGRESVTGIDPITPAEGDVNTLVFISEFQNYKFSEKFKTDLKKYIFANDPNWSDTVSGKAESVSSNAAYPKDSLRGYYQRASYGKLNLDGDIAEFVSEHDREYYEQGDPVNFDNDPLYLDAVNDWVRKILEEHDGSDGRTDLEYLDDKLKAFDQDGDMQIDGCYFACAGGNNGWGSRWWSFRTASKVKIGSYRLSYLVQVVDSLSDAGVSGKDDVKDYLETFIHETGHYLGLVDYYSYDNNKSDAKVNTDSMMGSNSTDQDGFAKMLLGWIPKDEVWVVTDGQVYNPKEKKWQNYTGSYSLALKPYAESGQLALILPKKSDTENWNWVYDQFIMAEYYKSSANDTLPDYKPEGGEAVKASDGLRLFRVYGKLNDQGTGFIAKNEKDDHIPLISDYNNTKDPYRVPISKTETVSLGVFHEGNELTPDTDPASTFYYNPSDDGLLDSTTLVDSGISITDIKLNGDGTLSFDTSFSKTELEGPEIKEAELRHDQNVGYYIKVTFDRPVNYNGGLSASVYDYNKANNTYSSDEKWGNIEEVRRSPSGKQYRRETKTLYYILKSEDYRYTDGTLVIPAGTVISDKGIPCKELTANITGIPEEAVTLSVSPEGGLYDKEQAVTINGAPEGSKIYYTLDGTEPTSDSSVYQEPIKLTASAVLKTVAYSSDGSKVVTGRLRADYTLEKIHFEGEGDPAEKAITLDVGEAYYLNPIVWPVNDANIARTYKSDDSGTVIVDQEGMLIARAEGTATISVTTENTVDKPAKCVVTVTKDAAKAVKDKIIEIYGIKLAGDRMRDLSEDLNGEATLQEFGKGWLEKRWIAAIPAQTYNTKAIKPALTVYDGVKKIEASNYTVSYKNNKNAGTATVTVKFKGKYKRSAPVSEDFIINPADVKEDLLVLNMGVKYNGKLTKPKPVILWKASGTKQALSASNFTLTYTDGAGEEVTGVKEEGIYYATLSGKGNNYIGETKIYIKVQK